MFIIKCLHRHKPRGQSSPLSPVMSNSVTSFSLSQPSFLPRAVSVPGAMAEHSNIIVLILAKIVIHDFLHCWLTLKTILGRLVELMKYLQKWLKCIRIFFSFQNIQIFTHAHTILQSPFFSPRQTNFHGQITPAVNCPKLPAGTVFKINMSSYLLIEKV